MTPTRWAVTPEAQAAHDEQYGHRWDTYNARREECMCGGSIFVEDRTRPDVMSAAVAKHNRTPRHQGYQQGLKYLPEGGA